MSIFRQAKLCAEYLSLYVRGTRGVAAMEYAIIVGVIVVGIGAAAGLFSNQIEDFIAAMSDRLDATENEFAAGDGQGG